MSVNYIAVLVCGAIYWAIGGLWYALIFGKSWQNALRLSEEAQIELKRGFPRALVVHLISGLLTSYVLVYIVRHTGAVTITDGMAVGFWAWLAFAFTVNLNSFMFEKRPSAVLLINCGFYLFAYEVIGAVLAVWT